MLSARPSNQPPVIQKPKFLASGPCIVILIALIMFVVYAIDIMTPLGVPVWLVYFIPLFLSFLSDRYYAIPSVCIVTLLFLTAGFVFSPPGIQTDTALFMRTAFSVLFIGTSVVLWMVRLRQIRAEILQQS